MCIEHALSATPDERNAREIIKPEAIGLPAKTTINYLLIPTNLNLAIYSERSYIEPLTRRGIQ